jgi:outer membrane protein assembly factor BamA
MRYLILLLCLIATPLTAAPSAAIRPPSGLIIGSIEVVTHNVFTPAVRGENKWLYREANRIHIQTRDSVIWRELLFSVGDKYDPALIAEMERNLRALPFIRRAEISATVNGQNTVDVVVNTYDSWSLEVITGFQRVGGVSGEEIGLADSNILGQGKTASAAYSQNGTAESKSFLYQDPQFLFHKHLQYSMVALMAPGNQNYSLSLSRPFYASIVPSAFGGTVNYAESNISTYSGGAAVGSVHKSAGQAGLTYGIALATSTARVRRVNFGLLADHADYRTVPGQTPGPIPANEQLGFLQLGGDWEKVNFIKVRRIQKFTHDEDYNLGLVVLPAVSWAPYFRPLATTGSEILPSISASKGFAGSGQLLLLNSSYSSKYVNGGNGNCLALFDAVYFARGLRDQTLAFHTNLGLGWHLDPAAPLFLGEANGLRGYGLHAFSGNKSFLFNIEDRIYIKDELWRLLDVGTVVFYDSGYVWPSSSEIDLADLRNSVGLGLRVAPSRSASNSPVRIDLAYALSDNQTRSRWSLSILAGQAFGPQ